MVVMPDNDRARVRRDALSRSDTAGRSKVVLLAIADAEVAVVRQGHCESLASRERITAVAELARGRLLLPLGVRLFAESSSPPRPMEACPVGRGGDHVTAKAVG